MHAFRLAVPLVLLGAASAAAQAPAGPEFRVNTYLTGSQVWPSVAVDGGGNFVVVWVNQYLPTDVRGQRFDRLGSPRGAEFLVHASTAFVSQARLAADSAGGFTVVWSRSPTPGIDWDVFARRFDSSGAPSGSEFRVNVFTTYSQSSPAIVSEASGAFVVVWAGAGGQDAADIMGQRFDTAGNRLGAEFVVNAHTLGIQFAPAVAMDGAGNFVVVWRSAVDGGNQSAIAGQRFTRDGLRIGAEFQVSASATHLLNDPDVAVAPGGDFVVAWSDSTDPPFNVVARRYDAAGTPRGPEFIVHTLTVPVLTVPSIAIDRNGRSMLVWDDADESPLGVEGRRYDATGAPQGRVFGVNTSMTANQAIPDVASDAAGNLLVAWVSSHADGMTYDVHAQRYRALTPRALEVDPPGGAGSDGNRVLEPGESVEIRPAWHNHTGGTLGLSGALSGIAGPDGATYAVVDGIGSYGVVPDEGTQGCLDCYSVSVSAPRDRPVVHWDARATEALNAGEEGRTQWLLHVGDSFDDVPRSSAFYRSVETLLHAGVTGGCTATAYCPEAATSREEMAVVLLVARQDPGYWPPFCMSVGPFNDVPVNHVYCRWIAELARRGVTGGCGGGNFCPSAAVTREQMAAFALRTLDPALDPPACTTPVFNDVPASSPFCRWIEELARRGVVSGCGGGNYCPTQPVTRGQMSVFLTGTFGLTLYGP